MRLLLLACIGFVFLFAFWSNRESDLHISARSDIEKILRDERYDEELLPIWRRALEHLEDDFDLPPMRINQPYERGSVNLYFFDTQNGDELTIAGRVAHGNFVTISPDVVFADEEFVKFFVDEYHFYRGALLQIWDRAGQFSDSDVRRTLIGSAMLRYANIDNYYADPYSAQDTLFSDEMAAEFDRYSSYENIDQFFDEEIVVVAADPLLWRFVSYLDVARKLSNGEHIPRELGDVISGLVAQAISFPVLHELGHINDHTDGGFLDVAVSQNYEIEQQADSYALAALASAPNPDWAIGAEFSATLLQQMVFARTFQVDFMDAQKLGHFIEYNGEDCRESVRGFFDFNLISDIQPTTLPLLSHDELDQFQDRLKSFFSNSHGFLLDRGAEIEALAILSDLSFSENKYSFYKAQRRDFLRAVFADDLESIEQNQRQSFEELFGEMSGLPEIDFDFSPFTNEARKTAAWCPYDDCQIISDDLLAVRYEETRNEVGIVFARLVLRDLFPRDSTAANLLESNPSLDAISNNRFAILLSFLDETTTFTYEDLLLQMRELNSCGFTSFERDEGTHVVRFSTIGNWYEVQVELIAKP